jgi:hypothetical protein
MAFAPESSADFHLLPMSGMSVENESFAGTCEHAARRISAPIAFLQLQ